VRQLRLFLETYATVPLDALVYCTGEANYGGRVTDDKDRRCLNAILVNFYNEAALQSGYKFQQVGAGNDAYVQPEASTHADYLAFLRGLPMTSSPEVFGLHTNAAITKDLKETRELFSAILLTQSRSSGGGGGSGDDLLAAIADDISRKLPDDFDLDATKALFPVEYLQSMNTVLLQELIRYNRLTTIVRSSLANLKKAIKGLVVMDADLEALATALTQAQRPALWMKRSYPSLKPLGGYVSDMLRRLQFFRDWIDNGMPESFWVSGFFFTQAFFTGTSQNYARKNGISIDLVDFRYEILEGTPPKAPEDGVHVYGLFLEGARYDASTKALAECEPKVLFTEVPMMWFQPMEGDKITEEPHYMCPLYKTSDRRGVLSTTGHSTNFVMYLKLPSEIAEAHWVKRGVAGLCQLDD
jgi:dynein heavy chain